MKISQKAADTLAVMRARARIGGGGKRKGKGGRRRGRGRGFFGLTGNVGGGTLFELGSVMVLGGVTLGSFFRLPAWLAPAGVALWLYGAWRGNQSIKSLGLLIIGLGLVSALGIPEAIAGKIQEAKARGILPMLGAGSGTSSPQGEGRITPGSSTDDIDSLVDDAVAVAQGFDRVADALA